MTAQHSAISWKDYAPVLLVAIACVGIFYGAPIVSRYEPDYLPGYLIQIPALLILYGYWKVFNLPSFSIEKRGIFLLSFIVPLANTFIPKVARKILMDQHILLEIGRPSILLLIALSAYSYRRGRSSSVPSILQWSFWLGLAGCFLATAFSAYPTWALGFGFFEFGCFWLVLYVMAEQNRNTLGHSIALYLMGVILVAIAQTFAILAGNSAPGVLGIPLFADEFLDVKKLLPLMIAAGGNGYGNTDNFASLWCMAVPLLGGLAYVVPKWKGAVWIGFAILLYAGLLIYSRSATAVVFVALAGVWVYRFWVWRSASAGLLVSMAFLAAIHTASPDIVRYYVGGIQSFAVSMLTPSNTEDAGKSIRNATSLVPHEEVLSGDISGLDRAEAWRRGWKIGSENWLTGVGFGIYSRVEPTFTAPHSMALERFAEGGVLSFVSWTLIALYPVARLLAMLMRKDTDMLAVACLAGVAAFFLKGAVFGATFAINGLIVWGFGAALSIAAAIQR